MVTNSTNNFMINTGTILSAIGAINWGLIGLLDFNLVSYLFANFLEVIKIIYMLVGLSGIYLLFITSKALCKSSLTDQELQKNQISEKETSMSDNEL